MKIGIDKIGFAMPKYFLDIADLAKARNINANKYVKGLLQLEMSIAPITQDIVTLGATAASEFLTEEDKKNIDMIIIGTESGIDQSKSASIFIHSLLGLSPFTRAIEVKEACYGGTAAIAIAKNHVASNPESSVLVITSDLAKYGIGATGESTQGAGSCAMLIKKDPSILILNDDNVYQTRDIMDFWRPNYSDFPHVDGHFSTKQYLDCLETTWNEYSKKFNKSLDNFEAICFHLPFPKIGLKGLNTIVPKQENENLKDKLNENFHTSIIYNQKVGNIYTGSLYLNLLSLLENSKSLSSGDNILMYSYGSGAVCEIFSVTLVDGFEKRLRSDRMEDFDTRVKLSIEEYEKMFFEKIELDENGNSSFINDDNSLFSLEKIENHMRIYKKNNF
ncbi:hydroxymethylglutaryl-CoA synthase [Leptotrichia sp. oral taxon 221]|uniref:hydroxymethylglutaryl-CoA synthase n=1 Tax=Leptotrichia sp. oral taxon 221 TaxID=712362 RepID=UPI001B8AB531|nr:hydroxymethylglutaryl-CoA synthase [Leptotrichia sp. oral taxon 221]QUB96581.1 hydroxymethylglutaryl-CoA synthase [Leptotrichia sp. oral taxon 221]